MKHRRITPIMFLLPGCIILGAFIFYPMIQAIWLSFTNYNMVQQNPDFVGVANYKELFADALFWKVLGQTLLYLIIAVPALVFLPIFLAILVNQQLKGITFFRSIYYLPVVTSMVVVGIAWKWMYADQGVLNYLLETVGLINEPIHWLTSTSTSLFAVMAVTVWKGLGYYMVIYLAGLQAIPSNLYEAAEIDGASKWRQIIHITIPLLMPSIMIVTIMSSISAMKVFEEIYVMTQGGPLNSSMTLVYYIYNEAFESLEMGFASAAGVILFIVTLMFSIVNIAFMNKREQAMKG
ncbi:putative chitobiose transport system permease protein [Thalassobacillus cyri]|uniref:Putative chitobiose transport system permease protein n=1 Tax=Thalassobacillus cyri TaxID=571932 RepID=A0A1H3VRD7_9BACI|nr:sugar ABC transporter permease [Thalassobacillus cyri]SDZ77385.1 putative chitobiose transport system permease protein [Thalassobacillus cyri]